MRAGTFPIIDLLIRDGDATKFNSTAVCELVHGRATNVERVPSRRIDGEHFDALTRPSVRELPAGSAVRGVEACEEHSADVRERGEAVEGGIP